MISKNTVFALSLTLLATSAAEAQIESGVMVVTGAEMH